MNDNRFQHLFLVLLGLVPEINSRRISIFGQVQHPGVFPHQQCLTLSQAIAIVLVTPLSYLLSRRWSFR